MDVFDTIAGQIAAVRLPLFAVTLTALPRADTPVLLILHWHGFGADPGTREDGNVPARRPVPGSALQLNAGWNAIARLDQAMLDAAWQLGAWELEREERRGCNTAGASEREALECRQAFGDDPYDGAAGRLVLAEAPDQDQMLQLGARHLPPGCHPPPCRSTRRREPAGTSTGCSPRGRRPPCPVRAQAPVGTRVSRTRYRLGQASRLIVPR